MVAEPDELVLIVPSEICLPLITMTAFKVTDLGSVLIVGEIGCPTETEIDGAFARDVEGADKEGLNALAALVELT